MVVRMKMEETILGQFHRLPGLPSEFAGLDTIMGRDEELGFEDYLNVPQFNEQPVDIHSVMENRLGLGVSNLHLRV
eukprot:TRINITY_DN6024_c0_g1_i2.p1 TRINITY_DN6024_c0_g1~~TRINITY_DN6024_c0_g1_i2.p1  ORF type:complete len:76 (-),score=24.61 TRINITY_DN6024_c0_g1_i2:8-235(-)